MKIWINDYLYNDVENRTYIHEPIDGLEKPSIVTSRGKNTGQHGGYIGAQQFGSRAVTLNGAIFSSDVAEALQKRREMQSHLLLYPQVNVVRILDDDGALYTFDAYLIDFKMPINRARMKSIFKIELEAPDPAIWEVSAGSALEAIIKQLVPGGFQFSATSPQFGSSFFFTPGSSSTVVTNNGEMTSYPVITIEGKITNPVLINRTTGESFQLNGYAVDASAVTVIDMAERTVKLNGGNAFAYAANDADWWGLAPGDNQIEFSSSGGGDVREAEISWRPGYWGI